MTERFDIVQFKKGKGDKTFAMRLGWATRRDDGGMWLNFDALPFGEGSIAVVPQRERSEGGARTYTKSQVDLLDDSDAPF